MDYRVRLSEIFSENDCKMPNEAVQSLFQRHRNCEGVVQNQFSPQVIAYKVWMKFLSAAIGVLISVIKDGSSGPKPKHRKMQSSAERNLLHCFYFLNYKFGRLFSERRS